MLCSVNLATTKKCLTLIAVAVFVATAAAQDKTRGDTPQHPQSAVRPSKVNLLRIGEIDFFGYGDFGPAKLRDALPVQQGQNVSQDSWQSIRLKVEETIKRLTGVEPTDITM